MKFLLLSAIALIGTGLISGQALCANFGTVTLRSGERQTVDISTSARIMRVCNDFFSSGPIVARVDDHFPRDLSPGLCAEDSGDRMTIQSHASGIVTVEFRSHSDGNGRGPMIEE